MWAWLLFRLFSCFWRVSSRASDRWVSHRNSAAEDPRASGKNTSIFVGLFQFRSRYARHTRGFRKGTKTLRSVKWYAVCSRSNYKHFALIGIIPSRLYPFLHELAQLAQKSCNHCGLYLSYLFHCSRCSLYFPQLDSRSLSSACARALWRRSIISFDFTIHYFLIRDRYRCARDIRDIISLAIKKDQIRNRLPSCSHFRNPLSLNRQSLSSASVGPIALRFSSASATFQFIVILSVIIISARTETSGFCPFVFVALLNNRTKVQQFSSINSIYIFSFESYNPVSFRVLYQ